MTDAHSSKHMAAYLIQVIDLHIVVAGNQPATLNAPDKDFHEKFYSNLLECIHHRRFKVDSVVEIDKRNKPMLVVLPVDNSMHKEIAKSFPSGEDVDDEVCRLSRQVFSPLNSVDNQERI